MTYRHNQPYPSRSEFVSRSELDAPFATRELEGEKRRSQYDREMREHIRDEIRTAIAEHEEREMTQLAELRSAIRDLTEKVLALDGWRSKVLGALAFAVAIEPVVFVLWQR